MTTLFQTSCFQNGQPNFYHFEHLFQPNIAQSEVFDEIKELILCSLHGRNVCLIAYGPTGSGKTFTMRGESTDGLTDGVIPRAIRFLLQQSGEDLAAIGWKYKFSASFIEVYNEEVFDLLDGRKKLDVKISGSSTNFSSLRKLPIKSTADVNFLLSLADSQRSTASTACNLQSSRSHAIFQIYVDGFNSTGETVQCCLNLVDLAGSERAKESGAQGKQFTELTNINQSLSILKKCIRAQMAKMTYVPYRESKLTILLREYLGAGSSKTMFVAHINPRDVSETKRTLEFTADVSGFQCLLNDSSLAAAFNKHWKGVSSNRTEGLNSLALLYFSNKTCQNNSQLEGHSELLGGKGLSRWSFWAA